MQGRNVLYPVQYMRAAAAFAVFFYHISVTISATYGQSKVSIDHVGAAGVDLFFVISGFIMAKIVWENPTHPIDFLWQRLNRIVPLYWAATLFLFAVAWFLPGLMGSTTADFSHLVHSLLFLPNGQSATSHVPILLVGWTLNFEMFFYVLVAVFAGLLRDKNLYCLSLCLVTFVVAGQVVTIENSYLYFYRSPIVLEFVMGIIVFQVWRATAQDADNPIFLVGIIVSSVVLCIQFEKDPGDLRLLVWGLPSALFLLCGLHTIRFKSEILRSLGDWSYAIYILHLFVILGFVRVLLPLFPTAELPWQVGYLIMTILLIAGSALVFHLFEVPMKTLLKGKPQRA